MSESSASLSALRRSIAAIGRQDSAERPETVALGIEAVDRSIGGGLARGRLHETFAAGEEDSASAAGFALMLALRVAPSGRAIVWLRQDEADARGGRLHPPGLAELGGSPSTLVVAMLPDAAGVLRAAADVLRCPEVGVAVIELWRNPRLLDLTASRRLALAAEASGVTALMLRADATPAPSAAHTRWEVRACPSTPLEADAPGFPALEISLLRQRAGPSGASWRVEWDRDRRVFRESPFPGVVVPLPPGRSAAEDPARRTA